MSLSLVQSLADSYSKVCRFCLQSNPSSLSSIYEKVPDNPTIVGINATIRTVLSLLGVKISQNDGYPNRVCVSCRDLLFSIQHFRTTAEKSVQLLDEAKLFKQLPPKLEPISGDNDDESLLNQEMSYEALVSTLVGDPEPGRQHKTENVKTDDDDDDDDDAGADAEDFNYAVEAVVEYESIEDLPEEENLEVLEDEEDDGGNLKDGDEKDVSKENFERINIKQEELLREGSPDGEDQAKEEQQDTDFDPKAKRKSKKAAGKKGPKGKIGRPRKLDKVKSKPRSNTCTVCGVQTSAMLVHMRTHTNERPFQCDQCDKRFYTNAKLRCHVRAVHIGERKFSCEVCGKAFVQKKNLTVHQKSHVQDKQHLCTICGKTFLFRWVLTQHQKIHTGEKSYVCTLDGCTKSFTSYSNLWQHQKTNAHKHHTESPEALAEKEKRGRRGRMKKIVVNMEPTLIQ